MGSVQAQIDAKKRHDDLRAKEHDLVDKATHTADQTEAMKHADELAGIHVDEINSHKRWSMAGKIGTYVWGGITVATAVASGGAAVIPLLITGMSYLIDKGKQDEMRAEQEEAVKNKEAILEAFAANGFEHVPMKKFDKLLEVEKPGPEKESGIEKLFHKAADFFDPPKKEPSVQPVQKNTHKI